LKINYYQKHYYCCY